MDSHKIKKLLKQVEDSMAAVSFAEEGQYDSAERLFKRERRVLLALKEGHRDAKTLRYALNSAARIHARLDILFVSAPDGASGDGGAALRQFEAELAQAGVAYRLVRRSGCLKQEIIDYTNREHEVLFVVVESPESLDRDCRTSGVLTELWKNLSCPLVVVSDGAGT
jgi:K+-sensing histidine kinase KdpD